MVGNGIEWCGFTRKMDQFIKKIEGGVSLLVQVQPRAGKTEYLGIHGEALKFRVTAPPVDGAANEACRRALAKALEVGRAHVDLDPGATGRRKRVRVEGDPEALQNRLRGLAATRHSE